MSGSAASDIASEVNRAALDIVGRVGGSSEYLYHVERAVRLMFDTDADLPDEDGSYFGTAAYWLGVATCWHLMTAINGQRRA